STASAARRTSSPTSSRRFSERAIARRRRATTSTTPSPRPARNTADSTRCSMSETATARVAKSTEVQWTRCPECDGFVYHKRLKRNLGVCPECNYHFRLGVRERLAQLLDEGSFDDLSAELSPLDPLNFADSKPYAARIADAQKKTGNPEGAVYGTATIGGRPLVLAAMDFAFIGGSMGSGVGEAITRAAELALERREPLLVISASGGARMQEGCVSLMQLAKTSQAIGRLNEEGVL